MSLANESRSSQMNDFLKLIELPNHQIYANIQKLYVPPLNYAEMLKSLQEQHILFLVSKSGTGTTFTSARLLWEFFQRGYSPRWISWGRKEMEEMDQMIEDGCVPELFPPKTITYFEDPFGKTFFGSEHVFPWYTLLEFIKYLNSPNSKVQDFFVIVSTNSDIFDELATHHIFPELLEYINQHSNRFSLAYDWAMLQQIFLNWGRFFNCKWVNLEGVANKICNALQQTDKTITPLMIKDFALRSKNVVDESTLLKEVKALPPTAPQMFAEQVASSSKTEKYFFSRFFIAPLIGTEKAEQRLQEFTAKHELPKDFTFDSFLEKHRDITINCINTHTVEFSHPSYTTALKVLLSSDKDFAVLFNQTLKFLAEKRLCLRYLARTILDCYELLPAETQDLIPQIAREKKYAKFLSWPLLYHYEKLPKKIQELLFPLARNKKIGHWIAQDVEWGFHVLPKDVLSRILKDLAENEGAHDFVWTIIRCYKDLSDEVKQVPFKLAEDSSQVVELAATLAILYNQLPEELKTLTQKLLEDEYGRERFASTLLANVLPLSGEARELFFTLLKEEYVGSHIFCALGIHSYAIPDELKEKIINQLSENPSNLGRIVRYLLCHYEELPPHFHELIFRFSDVDFQKKQFLKIAPASKMHYAQFEIRMISQEIARGIIENYQNLPSRITDLLFDMVERAGGVKRINLELGLNWAKLPETVQHKLLNQDSGKNGETWEGGIRLLRTNFQSIPEPRRTEIILQASKNDREDITIAHILIRNYKDLTPKLMELFNEYAQRAETKKIIAEHIIESYADIDENLKKILDTLLKDPAVVPEIAEVIIYYYDFLPKQIHQLIFQVPDTQLVTLISPILSNYERLPPRIQNIVFQVAKVDPATVARNIISHYRDLPQPIREILPQLIEESPETQPIAEELAEEFGYLPRPVAIRLVDLLLNKGEIAGILALIIKNYTKVGETLQQLLLKYIPDSKYNGDMAFLIAEDYKKMPNALQQILKMILEQPALGEKIADAFTLFFNEFPLEIQDKIFSLVENRELQGGIAKGIFFSATHFPDKVVALLPRLVSSLYSSIEAYITKHPNHIKSYVSNLVKTLDPRIPPEIYKNVLAIMEKVGGDDVKQQIQEGFKIQGKENSKVQ